MSDRIAVMSQGLVEQVGPPKEIYEEPATAYVADFLGVSNLMEATAAGQATGGCSVSIGEFSFTAGQGDEDTRGPAKVTIRPERVDLEPQGTSGENRVPGMVERVVYVGSVLQVIVNLAPGQRVQAWVQTKGACCRSSRARRSPCTSRLKRSAYCPMPAPPCWKKRSSTPSPDSSRRRLQLHEVRGAAATVPAAHSSIEEQSDGDHE